MKTTILDRAIQTPDLLTSGSEDSIHDLAHEWGERIEVGKSIARGGKAEGHVPGAIEQRAKPDKG